MTEATVIRLLSFGTGIAGPVIDVALRDEALPYLETRRGLVDVYVGRRGSAETGERVLATTWQTRAAMVAALGDDGDVGRLLPDHLDDVEAEPIEVYDLAFGFRIDRDRPPRVLRVVTGEVRRDAIAAFVDAVHTAALRAGQTADGTVAFHLGIQSGSFATVSVWPDWAAIEQGTGASIHDASAILAPEHVVSARARHFEMLVGEAAAEPASDAAQEAPARSS